MVELLGERPQCPTTVRAAGARAGPLFLGDGRERTWLRYSSIGIGWLVLILVAMFVMLALTLSNGGPAVPYFELRPFALPGAALLTASLLMER